MGILYDRCAICGLPLSEDIEDAGCHRGDCSMRPFPKRYYDYERAKKEYGIINIPEMVPLQKGPEPLPTPPPCPRCSRLTVEGLAKVLAHGERLITDRDLTADEYWEKSPRYIWVSYREKARKVLDYIREGR